MKGRLFLVPSSMGEGVALSIYNDMTSELVSRIDHFIVERTKTARRFIRFIDKTKDIDHCTFYEIDKHNLDKDESVFLRPILEGKDMILMSEAGSPAIADPGHHIIRMAHEKNITVIPVPGPSSIFLALMASGLNGQRFEFHAYLSKDESVRKKELAKIESKVRKEKSAEIIMETPYRNQHLYEDILKTCNDSLFLCIAQNISLPDEKINTKRISDWKKTNLDLKKQLCIFILGI